MPTEVGAVGWPGPTWLRSREDRAAAHPASLPACGGRALASNGSSRRDRQPLPQFIDQHPIIFRIIDGHDDEVDAAAGKRVLQRGSQFADLCHSRALGSVGLGILDEVGLVNVMPKSGKRSTACFQRIIPYALSSITRTTRSSWSLTAVSNSWLFIMKPPSPHTAMTRRSGYSIAAMMADGSPPPWWREHCRAAACWPLECGNCARTRSCTSRCRAPKYRPPA